MKKIKDHELGFNLSRGTHETPQDLQGLLYRGGAGTPIDKVPHLIKNGELGPIIKDRLPLVTIFHELIATDISRGLSKYTILSRIRNLRRFYAWCDTENLQINTKCLEYNFTSWVESLIFRFQVKKDIDQMTVYRFAKSVDYLASKVLDIEIGLLRKTRLSAPNQKKRVLGTQADKQNLEQIFEFGATLLKISAALDSDSILGILPLTIHIDDNKTLEEWSGLQNINKLKPFETTRRHKSEVNKLIAIRGKLQLEDSFKTRHPLINLRIEVELLIFIAQTGMNLSQAFKLKRCNFRYQTDADGIDVFRVHKHRRHGKAEFHIFKEYRKLFQSYLRWIEFFFPPEEERLFPFIRKLQIPAAIKAPNFQAIKSRCNQLKIPYFLPTKLRNTRINWLLRRSKDPELTAEMAQHTQETLLKVYAQPHHQVAASEISKFHRTLDPITQSPAPGLCIEIQGCPSTISSAPQGAPQPDCINPAGCFFCEYHRDIESQDYIWSLATYKYIKILELERYSSPEKNIDPHPAAKVIDRIMQKLCFFKKTSNIWSEWVDEANNRVIEGNYHPMHDGMIQLMEMQ
jgi:hypothetical protein